MTNAATSTETPAAVFAALVEDYRQAVQDYTYALYGHDHPRHAGIEASELARLHRECDRWLARFAAAQASTPLNAAPGHAR